MVVQASRVGLVCDDLGEVADGSVNSGEGAFDGDDALGGAGEHLLDGDDLGAVLGLQGLDGSAGLADDGSHESVGDEELDGDAGRDPGGETFVLSRGVLSDACENARVGLSEMSRN